MRRLFELDRRGYALAHIRWRAPWLDPVMVWATRGGTKGILWIAVAAVLLPFGPHARWAAAFCVGALLLAEGIINIFLKPMVRRERPFQHRALRRLVTLLVDAPGPHSWPSAHAGSSIAAGIVLAAFFPPLALPFIAMALLVAYSRIYVGVHYPLDVIAGATVGVVAALLALGAAAYAGRFP